MEGDKLYAADYTSGTRVFQIERDAEGIPSLAPIAHMDTEPRLPNNILNINQENKFGTGVSSGSGACSRSRIATRSSPVTGSTAWSSWS